MQEAQEGVPITVVAHAGDIVAGSSEMPGADNNVTRQRKKKGLPERSVNSFLQEEINQFVPQSTIIGREVPLDTSEPKSTFGGVRIILNDLKGSSQIKDYSENYKSTV